jgi:hypothetical protein
MQSFATFLDAAQNLTGSRQRDFMAKVANLNIYFTYIIKFIDVKILIIKILCLLKMYMTMRSNAKAKNRSHPWHIPKVDRTLSPSYSSRHWSAWLTALC